MVRNFNNNALTKLATDKGTEPLNFIEIAWQDGTITRYGDKDLPGINGKILEMSDLEEIISLSTDSSAASVSVTLDDTDGEVKSLMDQYTLHKRPCTVYQYFQGLSLEDACPILYGEIVSPIVWTEAERTVTLTIATKIYTNEVGFSVEEGQFEHVHPSLIGVVWPLAFGGVVHSPATKVASTITGTTMSLFGLPDPTLPLRMAVIQKGITSLISAYSTFVTFANKVRQSIPLPLDTQYQYINAIVTEDSLRQKREDAAYDVQMFNKQVDDLIEEYDAAKPDSEPYTPDEQAALDEIKSRITDVKTARTKLVDEIKEYSHQISDLSFTKKALEIDSDNEKYAYGVVGAIRNKLEALMGDFYRLTMELSQLQESYFQQQQLLSTQVTVMGGEYFPQNTPIVINFSGVRIHGTMAGRTFTIMNYLPTYTNVSIGPKLDNKLNTFFVTNSNTRLEGKYCYLSDGNVIKVTSQEGTKCTFETKTISKSRKGQKRAIEYSGQNASAINSGLSNILTGDESIETLNLIINTFPKDLSKEAWKRLVGENKEIRIKMHGAASSGKWTLTCNGLESQPLNINATAQDVEDELLDNAYVANPATPNAFTVTGGPLDTDEIIIKFDKLPLPIIRANCENLVTKYTLTIDKNATGGNFTMGCTNVQAYVLLPGVTAVNLNSIFDQYANIFTFTDVSSNPTVIDINMHVPDAVPYILANNLTGTGEPKVTITTPGGTKAFISAYTYSTGAHEHTTEEIHKMLQNYLGKGEYGPQLKAAQEKLAVNFRDFHDQNWSNVDEQLAVQKAYFSSIREFWQIRAKAEIPRNILEKAYAPISKHEYQQLYELEMYHYLEWVRSMTPLQSTSDEEGVYVNGFGVNYILEASPIILGGWLTQQATMAQYPAMDLAFIEMMNALPSASPWVAQVSSPCSLDNNYQEKYVCNILPSTISGVYAKRFNKGVEQLVPVPSSYYIKNESESYGIFNATTITLLRPLSDYVEDQWQEGLYVTFTSSVGPNTADIIDYIVTNYTNLTMDSTTYNHVKSVINKYPQNFVLFSKSNALELIKEIAWQARCLASVKGTQVYLTYLAEEPTPITTITDSDIIFGSLSIGYTETEDVNTKFIASWKPSYNLDKPYKLILRHNISRFGVSIDEHDYFTYNDSKLVEKSATFWMIRRCNTWKLVRFQTALNRLFLEVNDCVTLNLSGNHVSNGPVDCLVTKASYNSADNAIDFELWVPIRMGEMDKYQFFWPANLSSQVIFPTIEAITSGYAGGGITNASAPSGSAYDPNDPTLLNFRPKDYGSLHPSDESDEIPANPANYFSEIDYTKQSVSSPDSSPVKDLSDPNVLEKDIADNNPLEEDVNKDWLNFPPSFTGIGTVEEFIGGTDTELPDDSDIDITSVEKQLYKVRLRDGRVIEVRQMQIAKGEKIPYGTSTMVVYDVYAKEFQMQVPVYLSNGDAAGI